MTLGANEYEYIYKNRHGRPSQCRLGVTVTLAEHGWWERGPLPLKIKGSDDRPSQHTHTHTYTNKCRIMTFRNASPFKNDDLHSLDTQDLMCQILCVPEIKVTPISITTNCAIGTWFHSDRWFVEISSGGWVLMWISLTFGNPQVSNC